MWPAVRVFTTGILLTMRVSNSADSVNQKWHLPLAARNFLFYDPAQFPVTDVKGKPDRPDPAAVATYDGKRALL